MKVALCLSGMVGSSQRWGDGEQLDYRISYDYLKEVIINQCDVDIFIHSWSVEHEKELCNLYKPKDFLFEKQVDFKYKNPKSFAIMSQGYTRKSSVRLALNYEITNNINYDFIVLTRFVILYCIMYNAFDSSGSMNPLVRPSATILPCQGLSKKPLVHSNSLGSLP